MSNDFSLNVEFMSKELKFLFEILKLQDDDIILAHSNEWFTDIDWNEFLELAMHHRVYSLIYPKVKEMDGKLIPSHVVQTLYQRFKCFI